jgi:hypothetical protein
MFSAYVCCANSIVHSHTHRDTGDLMYGVVGAFLDDPNSKIQRLLGGAALLVRLSERASQTVASPSA